MKINILLSTLLLLPQLAFACEIPSGWLAMKAPSSSSVEVAAKLPEHLIKTGEQFDIDVMVCGTISGAAQIELDATMPAHKHGMNYLPEVSKLDGKIYRWSGLFFHMPGQWQITVDLKGHKTHRFYLDVIAK